MNEVKERVEGLWTGREGKGKALVYRQECDGRGKPSPVQPQRWLELNKHI